MALKISQGRWGKTAPDGSVDASDSLGQKSCRTTGPRLFFFPARIFPEMFEEFSCFVSWETATRKNSPKTPASFQCKIPRQIPKKNPQNVFGERAKWRFCCVRPLQEATTQPGVRFADVAEQAEGGQVPADDNMLRASVLWHLGSEGRGCLEEGRRNDNINKIYVLEGVGEGKISGRSSKNAVFLGKFHDNKMWNFANFIVRNFVVIWEAPKEGCLWDFQAFSQTSLSFEFP